MQRGLHFVCGSDQQHPRARILHVGQWNTEPLVECNNELECVMQFCYSSSRSGTKRAGCTDGGKGLRSGT
jgi:hypothetical protein